MTVVTEMVVAVVTIVVVAVAYGLHRLLQNDGPRRRCQARLAHRARLIPLNRRTRGGRASLRAGDNRSSERKDPAPAG